MRNWREIETRYGWTISGSSPDPYECGIRQVVFNKEEDIGTFTIKAVDDPRTLNKILYIKPPLNTLSFNELVSLWEKKVGKNLEKIHVPEEQVLKNIQGWLKEITIAVNYSLI
ncbi:hypothetical protein IFM89_020935 [Coptis chinensis]|uniref:NmrA-like domain-containing protein n=1 Tax=Coptis chinensis TaxID=261450 RepID=A0A835M6F2_9MAGN|nr:hypothetical protein IFM89_020935 [Coptis chinensis]